VLDLHHVHTYYGESHVLQGVDLTIHQSQCVALLGPNGMGKTTTLRTIMGLTPARSGSITLEGREISKRKPFEIGRLGLGYVPEDRAVFDILTVHQNLQVPFLNLKRHGREEWNSVSDRIYRLFPVLRERRNQQAGTLSGGEQQMLATARGLISGHKVLLLDEPTEGLAPVVVEDLVAAFTILKAEKRTMLLVEQNVNTALRVAERCYILEKGRVKAEHRISELVEDTELLKRLCGVTL
jgi:branched-chain amino acid transport system ATP-binding protein